ncbi:MAG: GNAT family acetyltransferase [Desulfobacteraceae bacterium]|nr:GNAT family acetyltransferase [Desulfobacteraceae bacterium]
MIYIRPFEKEDTQAVIALWQDCSLVKPWNDPHKDIKRKAAMQQQLFLVALIKDQLAGTVMAGYEGHRGWINYLAVSPARQRQGIGRELMQEAEKRLRSLGCPKINLQVRATSTEVISFYKKIGFSEDNVVGLGKRLEKDD